MQQYLPHSILNRALGSLALAGATIVAPLAAQAGPEQIVKQRTRAFYGWYVGQIKREKSPLANRAVMRSYVSRRLEKWLYSPAFQEYGADYFLDAQDFDSDWDKARAAIVRRKGNTATVQAFLGRPKPPGKGMGVHSLSLKWVRENGVWKIDRVNNQ